MKNKYKIEMVSPEELLKDNRNAPPTDKKLLDLLKKAYKGEFMCHVARIKLEGIKPYDSDYKPVVTENFVEYFRDMLEEGGVPLYVYQEGEEFIMSDDYAAYHIYKKGGADFAVCIVLGDPTGKYVESKSEPFKLEMEPIFRG